MNYISNRSKLFLLVLGFNGGADKARSVVFTEALMASSTTVKVSGKHYTLSGDAGSTKWLKEHIHEAVSKKPGTKAEEYDFKKGISKEDQERAIKTASALNGPVNAYVASSSIDVDTLVMDKVLQRAHEGQNTVFDILDVDKVHNHHLSEEAAVKTVLVYCPFHTLSKRVAKRNSEAIASGNPQEVRAGTFPLVQFATLFGPRGPKHRDSEVIDTVTRKTVEEDFDAHFDAGIADRRRRNPKETEKALLDGSLEKQRAQEKKALLTNLGFTALDPLHASIQLVSRKKYDVYIDTSDSSLGTTPKEKGLAAAKRIVPS